MMVGVCDSSDGLWGIVGGWRLGVDMMRGGQWVVRGWVWCEAS